MAHRLLFLESISNNEDPDSDPPGHGRVVDGGTTGRKNPRKRLMARKGSLVRGCPVSRNRASRSFSFSRGGKGEVAKGNSVGSARGSAFSHGNDTPRMLARAEIDHVWGRLLKNHAPIHDGG